MGIAPIPIADQRQFQMLSHAEGRDRRAAFLESSRGSPEEVAPADKVDRAMENMLAKRQGLALPLGGISNAREHRAALWVWQKHPPIERRSRKAGEGNQLVSVPDYNKWAAEFNLLVNKQLEEQGPRQIMSYKLPLHISAWYTRQKAFKDRVEEEAQQPERADAFRRVVAAAQRCLEPQESIAAVDQSDAPALSLFASSSYLSSPAAQSF